METSNLRLLCDPWVSPDGVFLGSSFPVPDNSHLRAQPELWDADWVAISSAQSDHLDSAFLAGLRDDVRVVIPAYPSRVLRDRLSAAGIDNIVELEGWQRLPLNAFGDWLTVVPEQSPMFHRAAVLICAEGVSVLHCNDAELSLSQTRRAMIEVGRPLDLLALEASEPRFRAVKRLVRTVKPRFALPYCGPAADELPAETLTLLPGDSVLITPDSHDVIRECHTPSQDIADLPPEYPDPAAGSASDTQRMSCEFGA